MAIVKDNELQKIFLKDDALTNLKYLDRAGLVNANGNKTTNPDRAAYQLINVETDEGAQLVRMPMSVRLMHPEYETPIKLVNVYVELATDVMDINGSKRASNELQLFAENFEIVGGTE